MDDDDDDDDESSRGGGFQVTLPPLLSTVPAPFHWHQAEQKMLLHVVLLFSAYIPGSSHSFLFPTWPPLGIQF